MHICNFFYPRLTNFEVNVEQSIPTIYSDSVDQSPWNNAVSAQFIATVPKACQESLVQNAQPKYRNRITKVRKERLSTD